MERCPDCGESIWSGHRCQWEYDDSDPSDCWKCAGEGYIADCFDGFCVNAEDGCELCMRRCDICNPAPIPTKGTDDGR